MGSGITYNGRVSYVIFLFFNKKLRGLDSKNTGATLSCAFSSQRPVNIYRPREGSIIYFFWGGGERRGCVVSRGNGVDMGRRQPSITDNGGGGVWLLQSVMGVSGKFYLDTTKILQTLPPSP